MLVLKSKTEINTDYLRTKGIPFTSYNRGQHLQINVIEGFLNFWPSTGKWRVQFPSAIGVKYNWSNDNGWDVYSLIAFLNKKTLIRYY